MPDKKSNQQDDIWTVIFNGLVDAVKMAFSIFAFFLSSSDKEKEEASKQDGWRDGHSGYGFYVGDIRNDDE